MDRLLDDRGRRCVPARADPAQAGGRRRPGRSVPAGRAPWSRLRLRSVAVRSGAACAGGRAFRRCGTGPSRCAARGSPVTGWGAPRMPARRRPGSRGACASSASWTSVCSPGRHRPGAGCRSGAHPAEPCADTAGCGWARRPHSPRSGVTGPPGRAARDRFARDRLAHRQHRRQVERPAPPPPLLDLVPSVRHLTRQPRSTSFPSGHSPRPRRSSRGSHSNPPATGSGRPRRGGRGVLPGLRGRALPGDVLAGAAIGVGAAVLTCRWWPPRPASAEPERRGRGAAPPRRRRACVFVNARAGSGPGPPRCRAVLIEELLPRAEISSAARTTTSPHCSTVRCDGQSSGVARSGCTAETARSTRRPGKPPGTGCPRGVPRRHPQPLRPRRRCAAPRGHRVRGRAGDAVSVDIAVAAPVAGRAPMRSPSSS